MSTMSLDRAEGQVQEVCDKLHIALSPLDDGDFQLTSKRGRTAVLSVGRDHLTFRSTVRARAYRRLEFAFNQEPPRTMYNAAELSRLRRQLDRLRQHRGHLLIEGEELTLGFEGVRSFYEPLELSIAIWRAMGAPRDESVPVQSREPKPPKRWSVRPAPREVAGAAIQKLTSLVEETTAGFSITVARDGDAIEARLVNRYDDKARLVVGFSTTASQIHRVDVRLVAELPATIAPFALRPRGFLRSIFRFVDDGDLEDEELDALYVANGGEAAREHLPAIRGSLVTLAEMGAEVSVRGKKFIVRATELDELVPQTARWALILWETLAAHARGA